jgi:hypothetical protein
MPAAYLVKLVGVTRSAQLLAVTFSQTVCNNNFHKDQIGMVSSEIYASQVYSNYRSCNLLPHHNSNPRTALAVGVASLCRSRRDDGPLGIDFV